MMALSITCARVNELPESKFEAKTHVYTYMLRMHKYGVHKFWTVRMSTCLNVLPRNGKARRKRLHSLTA